MKKQGSFETAEKQEGQYFGNSPNGDLLNSTFKPVFMRKDVDKVPNLEDR